MTATLVQARCNPYGAETGGPRHVLGGLYGPRSATTPGMNLPENVAQGEWRCANPGVMRCRMTCQCGHKGQAMTLCSWHDEPTFRSEMVAGVLRQVKSTIRVRGHYEEIQRRQSGACPRCLYPPPYGELAKEIQAWQADLSALHARGAWYSPAAAEIRQKVTDAGLLIDAAVKDRTIHRCPLTLVPVS